MSSTHRLSSLTLAIIGLLPTSALAGPGALEEVEVIGQRTTNAHETSNTQSRLQQEGVTFSAAGGVSALPMLNGFGADRVKVLVDGAGSGVACANQMNPPLSYVSGNQIATLSVMAGITPVSIAGDNIGGVISVNAIDPRYTDSESLAWQSGYVATEYRSVNDARQLSAGARAASNSLSLAYSGAFVDAESYDDGKGNPVLDTLYRTQNHSLVVAARDEHQQLAVKLSHQYIPFQGFPNQYMDMTSNRSTGATLQYRRDLEAGGAFEGQLNGRRVTHEMGFFTEEKPGTMLMNTDADEVSYKLQWQLPLADQHTLIAGHEYHNDRLNDWWPAVEGSMMMGPNDYRNIINGQRKRLAAYAELRSQVSQYWTFLGGVRVEDVTTNAGEVQAYNSRPMMGVPNADHGAAQAFNAEARKRSDTNVDVMLLARYHWNELQQLELGYARKNRSPNLYERYSWGRSTMAATMVGWFGDGNGYVGQIDLQPETAQTLSATYALGTDKTPSQVSITPYYTQVQDYIDAEVIDTFNRTDDPHGQRNLLQFTNLNATLYGLDIDVRLQLEEYEYGALDLEASLDYRHGERDASDEPLYQLQPLRGVLALEHTLGDWQNRLEIEWVGEKDRKDPRRLENATDHYTLVNVSSRYPWKALTLSLGIDNLLDEYYEPPLGGVNIAAFKSSQSNGFAPVAGPGRSLSVGARYEF
ncbi:TonB-dependent receptor plug domain-containing protein [Marinimicrobium locisalis]|uniref:TonB-dependent receptor plug domain-containing protein n=1 Tax=Marinimicrobium locisalis TaxID=546022 RepID=UPI0032216C4A